MDHDQRACGECGAIEWIDDMVDDGENDPICVECDHKWIAKQVALLNSGHVRYLAEERWYAEQGLLGVGKHDPRL